MTSYKKEIQTHRERIDKIDEEIVEKIKERVKLTRRIGSIKKRYNTPILDKEREEEVMEKVRVLAIKEGIDAKRMRSIFREIIRLCKEEEK